MPTSKVIWQNPEIDTRIKLKNARQLYESSVRSLKNQFILSLLIVFAVYFNIVPKIVNINLQFYQLFWKNILVINLIFLCCYLYQIIQTTYTMFTLTHGTKFMQILKDAVFYLIPQLKIYWDKIVDCKFWSFLSRKTAKEEEERRLRAKEIEERRRLLTNAYFPSMFQHQNLGYNDQLLNRSVDHVYGNINQDNVNHSLIFTTPENRFTRTPYTSTPFNNSADSVSFGGNITSILSPSRMESRFSASGLYSSPVKNENRDSIPEIPVGEVWNRLDINYNKLDNWTFSLKQWIHGTIITRIVAEIDNFNRRFIELGINDVVIGRDSVQTLRHLESQLNNPSLKTLIDFLDCCRDQAYLVNRLKELSQGCSLGKFQYDSGSSSVQYPWKEYLPNDTILVLHLFCTYIEARFTTHSNLHGVRTFNQQFITDSLINKDINELKDVFMLHQTSVQPPHFKVIFDRAIYNIPAGRKNLFHCLLVFFFKIFNNQGNFKWLNLGRSGMNVNFIFAQ